MVSLSILSASGLRLEWFEALAIVQELCEAIQNGSEGPAGNPLMPATAFIDSAGQVTSLASDLKTPETVQRVGAMLRDLLPPLHARGAFREVLDHATSTPSQYRSVQELSHALSYFERPDRTGIVRRVYERWNGALGPRESMAWKFNEDQSPTSSPRQEERSSEETKRPSRKRVLAVVAGAVFLAAMSLGTWKVLRPARQTETTHGTAIETAPEPAAPPVEVVSKPLPAALQGRAPVATLSPPRDDEAALLQNSPRSADEVDSDVTLPARSLDIPLAQVAREPVDTSVFGEDDSDVTRPIPIYPRQLGRLPAGTQPSDVGVIEVVVNEFGKVESTSVVNPPRSLDEALVMTMSLSAVKSWQFHPALREGQRVKYRARIGVAMR